MMHLDVTGAPTQGRVGTDLHLSHIPGVGRIVNIVRTPVGTHHRHPGHFDSATCARGGGSRTTTPRTANRSQPKKRVRPCRYPNTGHLRGLYFFLCASIGVQHCVQ